MPQKPALEPNIHQEREVQPQSENKKRVNAPRLPDRLYVSLGDAAKIAKVREADILHFGGLSKLRIVMMLPEGIDVRPFDSDTGLKGVPSFVPEMVVLSSSTCRRIECNGQATQGEFSRGCIFELLGPLTPILPSYANPQFSGRWCKWKIYKDGEPYSLDIVPQLLYVTMSDLNDFLRGAFPDESVDQDAHLPRKQHYWTDSLTYVLQASTKFWGNLGEGDRGKFPRNEDVQAWLMADGRDLSAHQAKAAASLIRPKFAGTGRPTKE